MKPTAECRQQELSGMFTVRKLFEQEALLSLLFNSALEYGIRKVRVIQESFELFGVYQLVVYTDDVSVLVEENIYCREKHRNILSR
jgi:hypothetical protein